MDQHGGGGTQEKKKEEEEEEQAKDSDLAFKEAHVQLECAAGAAAAAADARRQAQRERRFFVERQRRALRAVRPDLEAYGLAMRALGQLGQTQSSLQLLDMMRAAKLGVEVSKEQSGRKEGRKALWCVICGRMGAPMASLDCLCA